MRKPQRWEEKWKRFLYEGISPQLIDVEKLKKIFGFFHISPAKLSHEDSFTFTPKLPRYPYEDDEGNIIEDDFTSRISVAPDVGNALDAIEGQYVPGEWLHLYAGFGHPDVEAKQEDCPETDDMQYDTNFRMSKWLEDKLEAGEIKAPANASVRQWLDRSPRGRGKVTPSGLPHYLSNDFEHCVPDADETKESWLTKPTNLVYVGELNPTDRTVLLSNAGLSIVRKAGLKTTDY